MEPAKKPYRPGQWIFLGTVLGTFIGVVFIDNLALGMIFGFFIGAAIDGSRRKAASRSDDDPSDTEAGV